MKFRARVDWERMWDLAENRMKTEGESMEVAFATTVRDYHAFMNNFYTEGGAQVRVRDEIVTLRLMPDGQLEISTEPVVE